jgi:threonyl-tRNA synthetase
MADNVKVDSFVDPKTDEGLVILRHSCTHIMAQAIQNLWPGTRLGIGPVVENGFYYDFDLSDSQLDAFSPDEFKKIEKEMQKLINQQQIFVKREISYEEGLAEFVDEPFKLELISKKGNVDTVTGEPLEGDETNTLTIYDNYRPARDNDLDSVVLSDFVENWQDSGIKEGQKYVHVWKDLCKGPHLQNAKLIGNAFKIMKSSSAYWLGDDQNPQVQRLYGTAWASKEELKAYLTRLEEAEKRDHRKLGTQLDLFSFPDEIGSGLAVFHPKGGMIRMVMEDYSRKRHLQEGYSFVNTPHITKAKLYEISGHLGFYKENMFPPMVLPDSPEGDEYYLKPMNCPMHNLIFRARSRSYKELPLRLFEFGTVYRYEKSGVIHGLTRVRGLTQDDAHIYCSRSQMKDEITKVLNFVLDLLKDYGLNDFYLELSTKDPKKFVGSDEIWEEATKTLEEVAKASKLDLVPDPGGAAFYGPKISVQARDAIGRTWQMSTIQLDFNLPERFNLEFQNNQGQLERPIMIHRALFGSIERFFGVLTEHYAGAFPVWLAPDQALLVPVDNEFDDYLDGFSNKLNQAGIRFEKDYSDDRFPKKVRNASKSKVPFVIIAGAEDAGNNSVSFRFRDGSQMNGISQDKAIEIIKKANDTKIQVTTADDVKNL